jgi:hypothetical protein
MVKISDNVTVDEDEPEVLFDGLHHGDEHMSSEMAISIVRLLTDGYRPGSRIERLVDSREIYVVPMVNPDGGTFDITGGTYHGWRKNRQPNGPGEQKGTDVNRNYPYRWGCCGTHISRDPASRLYIGPFALSTPEARAMHDFVTGRVVDGEQQIRTAISFHSQGRLVMYPYGHTRRDVPPDMTDLDHRTFVALAGTMAASNGYRAIQGSDLYTASGGLRDWGYGRHRIFMFTFELTRSERPPDELIPRETRRNHAAVLYLIEQAECPYRVIGRAASHCGPLFDDLEIDRGWQRDPDGTDTATGGRWQRADPAATGAGGAKQLAATVSGRAALVTGAASGGCAACNDLDGGLTSIVSRRVRIPAGGATLHLSVYLAHRADSSAADFLRVRVRVGRSLTTVRTISGAPVERDARWRAYRADLSAWAGQTIRLQLEAADRGATSLVEAAVDDVRITAD